MLGIQWTIRSLLFAVAASLFIGCNSSAPPSTAAEANTDTGAYRLSTEPADAKGVKELRANAKNEEEITLVGRVGGDADPWIEGQAAFLVVDSSLKPCNENDDDACPTPWDYCCDTDVLTAHKAMVKIVDATGNVVGMDAQKLLGVKELQTVVVHGKAKRDEAGNLTILADGVFVRN